MITLKEIQQNYLAIDFFMSMSCNKDCHYCTSYTLEMRNLTVDMDFLKQTLHYLRNYKIRVCLLGGEPGLIKNLDDVIAEVKRILITYVRYYQTLLYVKDIHIY